MRLLWPLLITTSKAMSGREAIAYWTAVYRGEPVPELHTDYPTQKAIERRLQAVDAHAANKPRGGDDDLEEDDDGFTKRDAYRAMWVFYWICFTAWCLTGGPVLFISLFWLWRGNEPWGSSNKVQPEAPAAPAGGPASPDATTRRRTGRVGVDSGVEESKE